MAILSRFESSALRGSRSYGVEANTLWIQKKPYFFPESNRVHSWKTKRRVLIKPKSNIRKLVTTATFQQGSNSDSYNFQSHSKDVHVVKKGECLYRIAKFHGVTMTSLAKANKKTIARKVLIRVGEVLVIPHDKTYKKIWDYDFLKKFAQKNEKQSDASLNQSCNVPNIAENMERKQKERMYVVKEGDTVESIAQKMGISIEELKTIIRRNKLSNKHSKTTTGELPTVPNTCNFQNKNAIKSESKSKSISELNSESNSNSKSESESNCQIISHTESKDGPPSANSKFIRASVNHKSTGLHPLNLQMVCKSAGFENYSSFRFYCLGMNFIFGLALLTPIAFAALCKVDSEKKKKKKVDSESGWGDSALNTWMKEEDEYSSFSSNLPSGDWEEILILNQPSMASKESDDDNIYNDSIIHESIDLNDLKKQNLNFDQSVSSQTLNQVESSQVRNVSSIDFLRNELLARRDAKELMKKEEEDRFRWWYLTDDYCAWKMIEEGKKERREIIRRRRKEY